MRRKLTVLALSIAFGVGIVGSASAAPIDCPGGLAATKTADWWTCQTNSGNDSNAGDSSNPNGNPHFPR